MKIRAVIFDWAGTTVDRGSLAPVRTLERVFSDAGVPILEEEARRDMGIAKRDHIAALLGIPRIQAEWQKRHGRSVSPDDGDLLYQHFIPLQFECLREYSQVLPGVPEITAQLRSRGIKIGSTTGYTRAMLDVLVEQANKQGYHPDCSFSPEDAGAGRPHPYMIYAAAIKMQVYPMKAILKVGDTVSDIHEGLNAGTWSVGVCATGNSTQQVLLDAGAHYVVNSVIDLMSIIEDLESN
jgi:phosphonoacetaldehyde hydrolase